MNLLNDLSENMRKPSDERMDDQDDRWTIINSVVLPPSRHISICARGQTQIRMTLTIPYDESFSICQKYFTARTK